MRQRKGEQTQCESYAWPQSTICAHTLADNFAATTSSNALRRHHHSPTPLHRQSCLSFTRHLGARSTDRTTLNSTNQFRNSAVPYVIEHPPGPPPPSLDYSLFLTPPAAANPCIPTSAPPTLVFATSDPPPPPPPSRSANSVIIAAPVTSLSHASHSTPPALEEALSALILSAASLPQRTISQDLVHGRSGLSTHLPSLPFVAALISSSPPHNGVPPAVRIADAVKSFRRTRSARARAAARAPGGTVKSAGHVSKEASVAGSYFERQLTIAVMAKCLQGIFASAGSASSFSEALWAEMHGYYAVLGRLKAPCGVDGAVCESIVAVMNEGWERLAEVAGEKFKKTIMQKMKAKDGECSDVRVRNNAASRKTDEKRKILTKVLREQLDHMLRVRSMVDNELANQYLLVLDDFDVSIATPAL